MPAWIGTGGGGRRGGGRGGPVDRGRDEQAQNASRVAWLRHLVIRRLLGSCLHAKGDVVWLQERRAVTVI